MLRSRQTTTTEEATVGPGAAGFPRSPDEASSNDALANEAVEAEPIAAAAYGGMTAAQVVVNGAVASVVVLTLVFLCHYNSVRRGARRPEVEPWERPEEADALAIGTHSESGGRVYQSLGDGP